MPPPPTPQSSTPRANARYSHIDSPRSGTPALSSVLRHLAAPTLDLASTLSIHTVEDEVNDANVSFLRTHVEPPPDQLIFRNGEIQAPPGMTSDEEAEYFTRVLSDLEGEANSLRQQLEAMVGGGTSADTVQREFTALLEQRERQQAARRAREVEDRTRRERLQTVLSRLNRIDNPAYSDRVPNHNSLYDWSPATDTDPMDDSQLSAYIRELRQQQPNTHPEILRNMAQHRLTQERTVRSQITQNSARAMSSTVGDTPGHGIQSTNYSSRDLRSLSRGFRALSRGDISMGGTPTTTDHSIQAEERRNPPRTVSAAYQRVRESRNRRSHLSTQNAASTQDSRCQAPSSESNTWFHQAILYLASLRQSVSIEESLRYATNTGFAVKAFPTQGGEGTKEKDFVLDLWGLPPPAPTSLLSPGTVFTGMQKGPNTPMHPMRALARQLGSPDPSVREPAWWQTALRNEFTNQDAASDRWAETISASRLNALPPLESLYPQRDWLTSTESAGVPSSGVPPSVTNSYPVFQRTSAAEASIVADHASNMHRRLAGNASGNGNTTGPTGGVAWPVQVVIHAVDFEAMTLSAEMVAFGVPGPNSSTTSFPSPRRFNQMQTEGTSTWTHDGGNNLPTNTHNPNRKSITTYLEGEILDLRRTSFLTERFTSSPQIDATYWRKLEPFRNFSSDSELASKLVSRSFLTEMNREYLLMRWKERCFVRPLHDTETESVDGGNGENKETPSESTCGLTISGFYFVCMRRRDGNVEGFYYDTQSSPYQYLCLERERGSGGVAWEFQ